MHIKTPLFLGLAATLAATACTDPAYGPGGEYERTRKGALIGAAAGAVLGASRPGSNDLEQAAAGAVIGGVVGGVIGNVLDAQARDLRDDLSGNVGVIRDGDRLIVRMPQDLLFATDSAAVRPDLQRDLRVVAGSLLEYPDTTVEVVGHTDNTGSAAYNQDLSERRARSVAGILINEGVPSRRIAAYGRGEDQPIDTNLTPQGRQNNRRVEIIIRANR
jgi:outer membrane protein OmpA-like peptidoglycan-associated protein